MVTFTRHSAAYKKFMEKVGHSMNHNLKTGANSGEPVEFENSSTQFAWLNFTVGWASHPAYGNKYVSIIGRLNEGGSLTMAPKPRVHWRHTKTVREIARLSQEHHAKFVRFTCNDPEVIRIFLKTTPTSKESSS